MAAIALPTRYDDAPEILAGLLKASKIPLSTIESALGVYVKGVEPSFDEQPWARYSRFLVEIVPTPPDPAWFGAMQRCSELLGSSAASKALGYRIMLFGEKIGAKGDAFPWGAGIRARPHSLQVAPILREQTQHESGATSPSQIYQVGDKVVVCSLASAAGQELNGKYARIVRHDPETARYGVVVEGYETDGVKAIKECSLLPIGAGIHSG